MDIGLFGVEIFIEGCPDNTIRIYYDSEFLGELRNVRIVPVSKKKYFLSPPSCENTSRFPPFSTYFFKSSISVGVNLSLGAGMTNR